MTEQQQNSTQQSKNQLRDDVKLLGNLLGETIRQQHGNELYQLVESSRRLAKASQQQSANENSQLSIH